MLKISVFIVLSICFFFFINTFCAIPFVETSNVVEEPTSEIASLLIILEVWNPDHNQYKEICTDPKLSLEEFNLLSILSLKSGIPLSQIWRWRNMKLDWQTIIRKCSLTLDDVVPRVEKKWPEPYYFSYCYWREKGDPKKVFSLTDYNFEKLGEVWTLSKYSGKTIDAVIEEITKVGSFRELSLQFYKEKNKKVRKK